MSVANAASTRWNAAYALSGLPISAYARAKSFFASRPSAASCGLFRDACASWKNVSSAS